MKTLIKGKTIYSITKQKNCCIVFTRIINKTENHSSLLESLSINLNTYEVYCNRTGKQTFGIRRFLNLVLRIEKIFNLSSLRDF